MLTGSRASPGSCRKILGQYLAVRESALGHYVRALLTQTESCPKPLPRNTNADPERETVKRELFK